MYILGISAFYHDSAACLISDGEIIAAAQEERFTRKKHDQSFPTNAIDFCLEQAGININQVDQVTYYEQPKIKFERIIKTYISEVPKGYSSFLRAMRLWVFDKLWIKRYIKKHLGYSGKVYFTAHHESHAASAFYPSPFSESAILVMDGVGEWDTTSMWEHKEGKLKKLGSIQFPHSIGLLYSAFTFYTGFKVNSGEYKLMGLAPYGKPIYKQVILDRLIDLKEDGSFKLVMDYFNYTTGFTMTNKNFHDLFGRVPRIPESKITQLDMDLAASIQAVTEEIVFKIATHLQQKTKLNNLCLAGGVALNCVSNGKLLMNGPFENIWIQPAAGDAGGALGSAYHYWYSKLGKKRTPSRSMDHQKGSLLGTDYSNHNIEDFLKNNDFPYIYYERNELSKEVAKLLSQENVIGWFNGKMEFGPRALGSRSILGDPRSPKMQKQMNLKIKFRESFRPFAPIVLAEKAKEWFNFKGKELQEQFSSPYMLLVGEVNSSQVKLETENKLNGFERLDNINSLIPAVTHVNGSARLQTVHQETNSNLHDLLKSFEKETCCPVLINTSFNVRGEPIVESPEDAYRCFMRTDMDFLVLGNFLLEKMNQPVYVEKKDWKTQFKLD